MAKKFTGDFKPDDFVKLIVGQENQQTFGVFKCPIQQKWWGDALANELQQAENKPSAGQSKQSSPSSKSSKRQSITEALSPKKYRSSSSGEANITEIKLPNDDSGAWEIFLRWVMHAEAGFAEDTIGDPVPLVRCWNMGTYGLDNFRDDVTLSLMNYFETFEGDGTVNKCVSTKLIQEAYCLSGQGPSKLKDFIAQEIVKSETFHECNFDTPLHNEATCGLCRKDRGNVREQLKCIRPANKPHPVYGCALESEIWNDIVHWKRVYREQKRGGYLFNRLEKDPEGKAPVWMGFLMSDKWEWVRSMFADEPET